MFEHNEKNDIDYIKDEFIENEVAENESAITVSIPKVEPLYCNPSISNDDALNADQVAAPIIPSTKGYKLKDPIVLIERCDKIWETLKVIKDIQHTKMFCMSNVSSDITTEISQYDQYQLAANNYSNVLQNFKHSVLAKKKLFNCLACGKQFNCYKSLKHHSVSAHGYCASQKEKVILYKTNIMEDVEEKPSMSEKDKVEGYLKEVCSAYHGNNLHTHLLSQSASSPVFNNSPLQQEKEHTLILSKNDINRTESVLKDSREKLLNEELKHDDTSTTVQQNVTPLMCVLCKEIVKDMRQHLIDYHKIKSPDFMLNNLSYVTSVSYSKELESKVTANENLRKDKSVQKECTFKKAGHKINDLNTGSGKECMISVNKKLWLQNSCRNNTRQCDICLGVYKWRSFNKHMRRHRKRGETKENIHLSNFKYLKSPLYLKRINSALSKVSVGSTSDEKYVNQKNECLFDNKHTEKSSISNGDVHKTSEIECNICPCGKLFRQLHMFDTHKKTCSMFKEVVGRTIESSENRSNECAKCNSSNRDSEMEMNIRLKRNNDSYQIIEKDHEKENFSCTKDANSLFDASENLTKIKPQHQLQDSSEISEYSERHSILKIESVDMDTDIDVEADSQITFCNNNITSSANKAVDAFSNVEMPLETKNKQRDESCEKNANFNFTQKKLLSKVSTPKKYCTCMCGRKFYTQKALQVHMSKHSNTNLICGYCNASFPNISAWNKHQCSIVVGRKFHQIPNVLFCQHCGMVFNAYNKFDEHIQRKHSDSLVPYQCYRCPRRFPTCTARKQHITEEHKRNPCLICKNEYYDYLMFRHQAYHYGLGYPCHHCKKAYSTKLNLTTHNRKVHNNFRAVKYDCYKSSSTHSVEGDIHMENNAGEVVFVQQCIQLES